MSSSAGAPAGTTPAGTGRVDGCPQAPKLDPHWVGHLASFAVTSPHAPVAETVSPLTGAALARVPMSTADDVDVAYKGARAVQPSWAYLPPTARAAILLRLHDLLLQTQVELCDLIQLETGKSRRSAFDEVVAVCVAARRYARRGARALRPQSRPAAFPLVSQAFLAHRPVGVVGVLAPASAPLAAGLGPALAALVAGNAVVLRPPPACSLALLYAVELLQRAGCPPRVVQVVLGPGESIGTRVVDGADLVCFSGTARVARWVAARAAARLAPAHVQVIGTWAVYVCQDAQVDRAAVGAARALTSVGTTTCYASRVYVHRAVADDFRAAFIEAVRSVRIGAALTYEVTMGSAASPEHCTSALARIGAAKQAGARLLIGGGALPELGPAFIAPTVLEAPLGLAVAAPAPASASQDLLPLADGELPAPVALLSVVGSDAEAMRALAADAGPEGISALQLWTPDRARSARIARAAPVGSLAVNGYGPTAGLAAPADGGLRIDIGARRDTGAVLSYTQPQSITIGGHRACGEVGQADTRLVTAGLRILRALRCP